MKILATGATGRFAGLVVPALVQQGLARIATTGRRLVLHLPTHWPWASNWEPLWSTATGPPAAATT